MPRSRRLINVAAIISTTLILFGGAQATATNRPPKPLSGFRNDEVIEAIPRLRHRTTYHFRLVAHSRGGTTYGRDKTFRTLDPDHS